MSEGEGEEQVPMTAGERLRAAREAADMTIEDVATTTRIPTRHLTSLETGDYSKLPAPTYSVGFARSYAAAVGIDRNAIGEQVRAELGGTRLAPHQVEAFEPIDPARTMPRWLIFAVIGGIILVVLLASWLHNRSLNAPDNLAAAEAQPTDAATAAAPVAAAPQPARPVAITAIGDAWVQIKDGPTMLKEGVMKAGERFEIPPTATAPTLTTGKAEALTILVGNATAPQVGPSATKVRDVSLMPADLLRGPAKPVAAATPPPAPVAAPKPVVHIAPKPAAKKPAAAPVPSPAPVVTTNTAVPAPPPKQ